MRTAVESARIGLCVIDSENRISFCIGCFAQQLNLSDDELVGKPSNTFLVQGLKIENSASLIAIDASEMAIEATFHRKDGNMHTLFFHGKTINHVGDALYRVVSMVDISSVRLRSNAGKRSVGSDTVLAGIVQNLIRKNSHTRSVWRITYQDQVIHVLTPEKTFFSEDSLIFAEEHFSESRWSVPLLERLPDHEGVRLRLGAKQRSLSELLWHCGIHGSTHSLVPGVPHSARMRLNRWPDFGRLTATPWHFALTALLTRRACTVAEISNLMQKSYEQLYPFLNACSLCGLIDLVDTPMPATDTSHKRALPHRWYGVLRNIRKSLKL